MASACEKHPKAAGKPSGELCEYFSPWFMILAVKSLVCDG